MGGVGVAVAAVDVVGVWEWSVGEESETEA